MRTLVSLNQIDQAGCGLACVAKISGARYGHVKKVALRQRLWSPASGMTAPQLCALLADFGRPVTRVTRTSALLGQAAVVRTRGYQLDHWVVFEGGEFWDPDDGATFLSFAAYKRVQLRGETVRATSWYWTEERAGGEPRD